MTNEKNDNKYFIVKAVFPHIVIKELLLFSSCTNRKELIKFVKIVSQYVKFFNKYKIYNDSKIEMVFNYKLTVKVLKFKCE